MTTLEGAGAAAGSPLRAGPGSFASPSPSALLRAVHDSATDLASVRDRAVILRALVRRTRALLGADMAYLSLNDLDAGETWIHVTDGVRTRAYARIRMPLGTGILGSVAAGGTSVHTDDYLADADLNHLSHIDEAVAAEGVRAISGEPLRVDGHLVGALLVAQRTPVAMPPAGLEALRLLALQAAVALEQTRRASEITALRTRADGAAASSTRHAALLALDARLLAAVRDGGGCHAVVDELAAELGAPVALLDADGSRRCGSPPVPDGPVACEVPGGGNRLVSGDRSAAGAGPQVPTAREVLERGALAVGLALQVEHELAQAADRSPAALLDDLLEERSDDGGPGASGDRAARREVVEARALAHGVDLRSPAASLVLLVPPADRQRSAAALRPLVARGGLVAVHAGHVCVVCTAGGGAGGGVGGGVGGGGAGGGAAGAAGTARGLDADDLGGRAEAALAAAGVTGVVGCAAADAVGAGPLARAHAEAAQVARAAQVLGWRSGHVDRARLGVAGLLLGGHDPGVVDALVERQLGAVLAYDAQHGTHLAETAAAVLEEGSRSAAAARLFVHVNTVRQRVDRLDQLLGSGWEAPPRSLDVHAALRLLALRRST